MTEQMNEEIREAIEKNLPTQVAGEMKKALEKLEDLEEAYVVVTKANDALLDENKQLKAQLSNWEKMSNDIKIRKCNVVVREKVVTDREIKLDLTISEKYRECAEQKVAMLENMMNTVFKNTVVRKSVLENGSSTSPGNGGLDENAPNSHPTQDQGDSP